MNKLNLSILCTSIFLIALTFSENSFAVKPGVPHGTSQNRAAMEIKNIQKGHKADGSGKASSSGYGKSYHPAVAKPAGAK